MRFGLLVKFQQELTSIRKLLGAHPPTGTGPVKALIFLSFFDKEMSNR
jgi:hypothetical protein